MATTFDSTTKMISHYVNGRPFSREKINTVGKLNIGSSTLGHSAISVSKSSGRVALSGKIDEFALFEKSFDELEVRRIYEIGCPYESIWSELTMTWKGHETSFLPPKRLEIFFPCIEGGSILSTFVFLGLKHF